MYRYLTSRTSRCCGLHLLCCVHVAFVVLCSKLLDYVCRGGFCCYACNKSVSPVYCQRACCRHICFTVLTLSRAAAAAALYALFAPPAACCLSAEGRRGLAAGSSSSITVIGGVAVPTERLISMQSSNAAELLLKPAPGVAGIIMLSLLHLSLLSLLCNVALLAAHGVVYWLMPALLNDAEFDAFYPLAPFV